MKVFACWSRDHSQDAMFLRVPLLPSSLCRIALAFGLEIRKWTVLNVRLR
jgi:hypothetical protein